MQLLLLLGRLGAELDFARQSQWLRALLRKAAIWLQQASPVETQMFQHELRHYKLRNLQHAPLLEELLECAFERDIAVHTDPRLLQLPATAISRSEQTAATVEFMSFANCSLWRQQQEFYKHKSVRAWTDNHVPWQISNNGLVAAQYVRKFAAAVAGLPGPVRSIAIVELGAGHGQLSLALAKLLPHTLANVRIKAVATDFHEGVFRQQLELPWVHCLCAQGLLDFCVVAARPFDWRQAHYSRDAEQSSSLGRCLFSGKPLGEELRADFVVVVGNYAYDSFPVEMLVQTVSGQPYLLCATETTAAVMDDDVRCSLQCFFHVCKHA
jgi:hypothetical protein